MDTNWDINQYRTKFEPMEHWDLKKEFLLAHKNLIAEERLVCLAQVYVNMELLGCRYPHDVARQVKELAKGLGQKYENSRQNKLERTFVKASDAALAKIRKDAPVHSKKTKLKDSEVTPSGLQKTNYFTAFQTSDEALVKDTTQDNVSVQKHVTKTSKDGYASGVETGNYFPEVRASFSLTTQPEASPAASKVDYVQNPPNQAKLNLKRGNYFPDFQTKSSPAVASATPSKVAAKKPVPKPKYGKQNTNVQGASGGKQKQNYFPNFQPSNSHSEIPRKKAKGFKVKDVIKLWSSQNPLQKIILLHRLYGNQNETNKAYTVVKQSVDVSHMSYDINFDQFTGNLVAYIADIEVGSVICDNLKDGKGLLSEVVLETLCELCCLLEIKKPHHDASDATTVNTSDAGIRSAKQEETVPVDSSISSENIGNKLLKMMGWTGGGLGKDGTGRAEPVEPSMITGRQGLGYTGPADGGACTQQFKGKIHQLLHKFVAEVEAGIAPSDELVFSPNFSKEQRAFIHQAARKYKLKTRSHGTGSDRYLVLGLKIDNHQKIINVLQQGGESDLFTIHMPGTYDMSIFNLV